MAWSHEIRHGVQTRVKLSKTQSSWTDEEIRKVFDIPYVFAVDNMGMLSDTLGRMLCLTLSITTDIGVHRKGIE
ncbi:UNVERIFIED_CONTAM: hypothetical protein Sradi_5748300 [Sesamum radiatum]|uniref:Uncharacterized protein n=1 Tax=Sesamum radiatum TaxID=300843 RepID=A0AAW2L2M0_SESRA